MHFELVPDSTVLVAVAVAVIQSFSMIAAHANYLLMMALVVTLIEYVAFELVVVSTACKNKFITIFTYKLNSHGMSDQRSSYGI